MRRDFILSDYFMGIVLLFIWQREARILTTRLINIEFKMIKKIFVITVHLLMGDEALRGESGDFLREGKYPHVCHELNAT